MVRRKKRARGDPFSPPSRGTCGRACSSARAARKAGRASGGAGVADRVHEPSPLPQQRYTNRSLLPPPPPLPLSGHPALAGLAAHVVHRDPLAAHIHRGEHDRELESPRADRTRVHDDDTLVPPDERDVRVTADDD